MEKILQNNQMDTQYPSVDKFDGDNYSLSLPPFKTTMTRSKKILKSVRIENGEKIKLEMQDGTIHELSKKTFWIEKLGDPKKGECCVNFYPVQKAGFKKIDVRYFSKQESEKWAEELNARIAYMASPSDRFFNRLADKVIPFAVKYNALELFEDLKDPVNFVMDCIKLLMKKRSESTTEWFYVSQGAVQGPILQNDFLEMVKNKTVDENTPVWNAGMGDKWLSLKFTPLRFFVPKESAV